MNRVPTRIEPVDASGDAAGRMLIGWSTGEAFRVPYFELRFQCPCAACVDEHTGKRTLRREQVDPKVRPLGVQPIGRYAIQIAWSDRHSTGMYHFDSLYGICAANGEKLAE